MADKAVYLGLYPGLSVLNFQQTEGFSGNPLFEKLYDDVLAGT